MQSREDCQRDDKKLSGNLLELQEAPGICRIHGKAEEESEYGALGWVTTAPRS